MKHTPGKWKVDIWEYILKNSGQNPPRRELAIQNDTNRIAVLDWDQGKENPYTIPDAEAQANAWLIAAAPELLEACRYALAYIVSGDISREGALNAIRAAIAKAEGRDHDKT